MNLTSHETDRINRERELYDAAVRDLIEHKGTDVNWVDLFMLREAVSSVLLEHPDVEETE